MGDIRMSYKERRRLVVMARVNGGEITMKEASDMLGISYRQVKRIRARYKREGDIGLVHRSRGRESNRGYDDAVREVVLKEYQEKYLGFGPTLFSEKLDECHGLEIGHEALRRWLIKGGLWQKQRKRSKHRKWRERKEHFGELVQMDGSHHEWFDDRGSKCCLMVMVDDATGHTMALMSEEETTEAAMRLLWLWIDSYGIPVALYTDRKNVYISDREPSLEEELSGQEPITVFGKACRKLGIRIIPANSPQAKGRVERKNGVFQDRWVKELRLKGISDIENANRMLPLFTDKMNDKFAVIPFSSTDYHQPLPEGLNLEDIFCWEETRTLGNDWTVRFESRWFQIPAQSNLPPSKGRVMVRKRLDGSLQIVYRNQSVDFEELLTKPVQKTIENSNQRTKWIPAPDHPWRNNREKHQGFKGARTEQTKEPALEPGAARVTVTLDLTPSTKPFEGTFLKS